MQNCTSDWLAQFYTEREYSQKKAVSQPILVFYICWRIDIWNTFFSTYTHSLFSEHIQELLQLTCSQEGKKSEFLRSDMPSGYFIILLRYASPKVQLLRSKFSSLPSLYESRSDCLGSNVAQESCHVSSYATFACFDITMQWNFWLYYTYYFDLASVY